MEDTRDIDDGSQRSERSKSARSLASLVCNWEVPLIPLLELDLDREMHRPPGVVDSGVLLGHDVVNHRLKHMSFTDHRTKLRAIVLPAAQT